MELIDMDIDKMPAGLEMDKQLALEVMGWRYAASPVGGGKFWQDPEKDFKSGRLSPVPYTTMDIGAILVARRMAKLGFSGTITLMPDGTYGARFDTIESFGWAQLTSVSGSLSLSVGRAALKAIRGSDGR
jgi:hypothetical protein